MAVLAVQAEREQDWPTNSSSQRREKRRALQFWLARLSLYLKLFSLGDPTDERKRKAAICRAGALTHEQGREAATKERPDLREFRTAGAKMKRYIREVVTSIQSPEGANRTFSASFMRSSRSSPTRPTKKTGILNGFVCSGSRPMRQHMGGFP